MYHFNVGQCIIEGIAIHGTLFLLGTATLFFWNHRRWLAAFFVCCAVGLAGIGFNALYWEPYHLKVEYYEVKTSKIKKSLRIVFVSDIQTDRIGSYEINTIKTIQRQQADLIIFGGDYIQAFRDTREKHLPEKFRQMLIDHPLKAPLGVFALAGNIGGQDAGLFKDTGVEFFQDSTIFDNFGVDQEWGPIDLIFLRPSDSARGVGDYYLTDSGNLIVMAGHYPNYAVDGYKAPTTGKSWSGYRNAERAPDLMLAGHSHGGQIVIPFYGPLPHSGDEFLNQVPRSMWSGFFVYPNGGHLVVTRGSGMERGWAPRMRLFCPPEISVIDIVAE
jgi:predicted MPP superfamily phosphohydrolase